MENIILLISEIFNVYHLNEHGLMLWNSVTILQAKRVYILYYR